MLGKAIVFFFLIFCINTTTAQDSIPSNTPRDTTRLNTIVIRVYQHKIKIIPRGVNFGNPSVSFKKASPIADRFKRFKMPSFWEKVNDFGLNFREVTFVNWNAGGDNSISGVANIKISRNYKFRHIKWDNDLVAKYGLNAQEGRKPRKTSDAFRISSTFSYRRDTISNWYYSVKAEFNTQFYKGYKNPEDPPISRLMAPGYLFIGTGTSCVVEDKKLNFYISPLTHKITFVLNQDLANKGAFGVQKALVDRKGNILREGDNTLIELGFLVINKWETKLDKNIYLDHRLGLYTDYLQSFGNVDIDWELKLSLMINKYVKTSIGTHIIFDDDVKFHKTKAIGGIADQSGKTKVQFKQLLGVGLIYSF